MNTENFILKTDSYKMNHFDMYPDGTQNVYSYFESRVGAKYPATQFFGLQMVLKKHFSNVKITNDDIEEARVFSKIHFGMDKFNEKMWRRIVNVHNGKLPLLIKAVPEGMVVPVNNVMMTVESTDNECAPLTNVCETILTHIWYPNNVATMGYFLKKYMEKSFEKSVGKDQTFLLDFLLHDFGFRGASCVEAAGIGGAAHLLNFKGTDTIEGIVYANKYYNSGVVGFSVPASEHSVMTALGEDGEMEMVLRLIDKYPSGILSVVSDSYNIQNAIQLYGTKLKHKILGRNGKFVIRPDSPRFKGDTPKEQIVWIANELEKYFGCSTNEKGYKVLHPNVGIIYGDGLNEQEVMASIDYLIENGYAASNCVYGMGGNLLQKHNRDTQRNAFKCSAQLRNDEWFDIYKKPLDMTKASKKGRLKLVNHKDTVITVPSTDPQPDILTPVLHNGNLVKDYTWEEVQQNNK